MVVVVVAGRGGSRSDLQLALHCTALRKGGRYRYISYHTITTTKNTRLAQSWIVQVQMEGGVNWKVVSRGAYMEENAKGRKKESGEVENKRAFERETPEFERKKLSFIARSVPNCSWEEGNVIYNLIYNTREQSTV